MGSDRTLVLADLPLGQAAEFNFERTISTMREFISSAPADAPFSICVSGSWGTGKTTLLKGLESEFAAADQSAEETKYVTIWFDPWKLSSEDEVRNALARAVLKVIESDGDFVTNAKMSIERKNVVRMLSERLLKVDADEVSTFFKSDARMRDTFVEVEEIFQRVAEVYLDESTPPRRLVIFVDDLDRCRPEMVTKVLESVKLFFDLPGLIFVFALDETQLERAVASDYKMTLDEAREYLEKIFQLRIKLPRKTAADLRAFLSDNLKSVGVELQNEGLYTAIVERYGRNLRNLKLFINWFSFHRQLIGVERIDKLSEEALFGWLYLESTMVSSMNKAVLSELQHLALALEFLANGGFLRDDELRERYLSQLEESNVNYVALIAYSLFWSEDEQDQLPAAPLEYRQREMVEALRADGPLIPTLKVIGESGDLFIDHDLTQMIYLTRGDDDGDSPVTVGPGSAAEEEGRKGEKPLVQGNPLSAQEWNRQGDKILPKDPAEAYLCYLLSALMEPGNAMYLCDLARVYRRADCHAATRELQYQAHQKDPSSVYVIVETAHYFDTTVLDEEMGSLLYRKALEMKTETTIVPYYLAMNLHKEGQYEDAYLACLDAVAKDPESKSKRERLVTYARDAGLPERALDRETDEIKAELQEAVEAGAYPLRLSPEEQRAVEQRLNERPDEAQAEAELSRPPF